MSTEITINQDIVDINVSETVVVIEAPSGAYPLPTGVFSVFGRSGNVVATDGDYSLNLLGDVTLTSPSNGQVLKYNGTAWVNGADNNAVTSVFGRTGAITAQSGDYNTLQVTENTNLYFTDQRARYAISGDATSGVVYQNTTGIIALDDIPNTSLLNSSVTVNGSTVALGGSTSFTTSAVSEGTNLYYTDARARAAITGTAPISVTSGVVSISQSGPSTNGYLSSADWNTFNGKQSALTLGNLTSSDITVTGGTGAVVGSGSTLTLATVNSNVGQFGSSTAIPVITVNGKGLVTAMSTTSVSIPSGALNFIGDVTGSGTTGSDTTLTLATVNSNVGAYGSSTSVPTITVNAKGLVTAASQTAIPTASGSTTGLLTSTDWTTFNGKQAQLNGTGFVKVSGTTVSYDNSTYLTTIEGIAAGGELSGTYASPSLVNSAVTGKVLTGLNVTGGTVSATDSILAAFGKVQNQINGLIGGSIYQGTWNASTNTPALASGVGTKGYYYIVSVAGTTNLDGITDWNVGDWAIYDGTAWQQVDNTDAVVSVNGYTGAVNLTTSDITEGTNLYYTDVRARASNSAGTGISYNSTTGVITNSAPDQTVSLTASTGISTSGTYPNFTITNTAPDQTVSLTASTGISTSGTYPNFTITNTAPDQTVSLTGAGTTSITGTYPNFTVTSNDQYVGTVTSVAASLPISSSGGATPNLTITQSGTATDGYLSSTDWNTFNNKVSTATLAGYVPYTGATTNVNLGTHSLTAADLVINHTSGSGVAASITKGGNDEALTVVKTSGSGNAASITGGVTLLSELHLTTDLADAYIASATTWNAKQDAITLTTTGNSGASTFVSNTLNIPTYTLAGLGGINLTSLSATSPLLYDNTTGVFSIQQASGSQAGFLAAADWTTFNNKVPSTRTLSINGTTYDLSADRSWTITPNINATNTQDYTATSGQTTFTVTGGYTVGQLAVFYNGSKLAAAEFTATDGTTFVLATACQANDIVQAVVSVTGGGIGGSGTTNYLAKFSASGVVGNSLLFDNGTNVGIGTASPNSILEIKGSTTTNSIRLGSPTGSDTYNLISLNGNSAEGQYIGLAGGGGTDTNLYIQSGNAGSINFRTGNGTAFTERMRLTSGGDLCIGVSSSLWNSSGRGVLHLNGASTAIYGITIGGSNVGYLYHDGTTLALNNNLNQALTLGTGGTEKIRIASGGELCINTTITTGRLTLYENGTKWAQLTRHDRAGFQFFSVFLYNTTEIGSITGNNTNTTFATTSDYRLKEDLKDFNGVDLVNKLNVYDFAWKSDNTRRMYGVVAHEMAEVLPYAVNKEKDLVKEDGTIDPQGVDYSLITPLLVKAIQEQQAQIDELKKLINK